MGCEGLQQSDAAGLHRVHPQGASPVTRRSDKGGRMDRWFHSYCLADGFKVAFLQMVSELLSCRWFQSYFLADGFRVTFLQILHFLLKSSFNESF